MKVLIARLVISLLLANFCHANTIISYEGDVLPEDDGWMRYSLGYGDNPEIDRNANGIFSVQFPSNLTGGDSYLKPLPDDIQKGFFIEWRLRTDDLTNNDGEVTELYLLDMNYHDDLSAKKYGGTDGISIYYSCFPDDTNTTFHYELDTTVWHNYRINFLEPRVYQFLIDDFEIYRGNISPSFSLAAEDLRVGFSIVSYGTTATVEWDYIRFGVIPEPSSLVLLSFCLLTFLKRNN